MRNSQSNSDSIASSEAQEETKSKWYKIVRGSKPFSLYRLDLEVKGDKGKDEALWCNC